MTKFPFVLAKTRAGFDAALEAGEITADLLVFIQETKEIWTREDVWPCPYSKEELDTMIQTLTDDGASLEEALEAVKTRVTSLESGKVDKVENKSLVSNDLITKLEGLKSLSDTDTIISEINTSISEINTSIVGINKSIDDINNNIDEVEANVSSNTDAISEHSNKKDNPHGVTKTLVGLGNVDNTSDKDKPISDATLSALNEKVDKVTGKSLVSDTEITKLTGLKSQTEITADITAEKTRAEAAEGVLTNNLSAEASARLSLDETLKGLIDNLTDRLNTLADSDDDTLDLLSEIVAYIKSNKELIDGITIDKVNVSDIVNTLTSTSTDKPLSAAQGKALKDLIDTLSTTASQSLDTKVDKVTGKGLSTNDYTTEEKTKLAGIETGALVNTVTSVAGKTGAVTLSKGDVGLGNVDNTSDENKPISAATLDALDNKVDKVTGKGLSSNDYTSEAKTKVDAIPTNPLYTDTTYTFTDGTDGSFNVTPKDGTAQKISIGKPATATTADKLGTDAGSATKPVYFSKGVPVAGTNELKKAANSESYLDVSADGISVTGIDALKTRIETLENRVGFETID